MYDEYLIEGRMERIREKILNKEFFEAFDKITNIFELWHSLNKFATGLDDGILFLWFELKIPISIAEKQCRWFLLLSPSFILYRSSRVAENYLFFGINSGKIQNLNRDLESNSFEFLIPFWNSKLNRLYFLILFRFKLKM